MATKTPKTKDTLRAFALELPGAREDFPWGERVMKVGKKVFVFMGVSDEEDAKFGIAVKLPESGALALSLPFVEPCGYGLGKSGWVSVNLAKKDRPPYELLCEWILESYRAVAPKKLSNALDGAPPEAPTEKRKRPRPAAKKKATTKAPVKRARPSSTRARTRSA